MWWVREATQVTRSPSGKVSVFKSQKIGLQNNTPACLPVLIDGTCLPASISPGYKRITIQKVMWQGGDSVGRDRHLTSDLMTESGTHMVEGES